MNITVCEIFISTDSPTLKDHVNEIRRRLCAVKSTFYVRYKWVSNNHSWLHMTPVRVIATSSKQAAQTLRDSNIDKFQGDLSFMVSITENSAGQIFHLSELE